MEHEDLIVSMKGIQKSFGGVHALTDGELTLRKGEVLGLMRKIHMGQPKWPVRSWFAITVWTAFRCV